MSCMCNIPETILLRDAAQYVHAELPPLGLTGQVEHLARAVADFMARTNVVESTFYFDAQREVDTYRLECEHGFIPLKVREVFCAGRPLPLQTHTPAGGAYGCPMGYSVSVDGSIRISPAPFEDMVQGISVRASLGLSRDACAMPKVLMDRWQTAIVAGALSSAFLIHDTSFHDKQLAGVNLRRFEAGIRDANYQKKAGFSTGPMVMTPRGWA